MLIQSYGFRIISLFDAVLGHVCDVIIFILILGLTKDLKFQTSCKLSVSVFYFLNIYIFSNSFFHCLKRTEKQRNESFKGNHLLMFK